MPESDFIGSERLQYDIWGDTVNVASRMESSSVTSRIQSTEVFIEALHREHSAMGFEERGTFEVKGKGLMKTYLLTHE